MSSDIGPWVVRLLLVGFGYLLAARLGQLLPGPSAAFASFWPPAGVALAALVRWGSPCAGAVFVASLLAGWLDGSPAWLALALAVGDTAGPWLAARWLVQAGFDRQLPHHRDLLLLLALGILGSAMLSAANGTAWWVVAGRIHAVDLPKAWFAWWAGHALGVLLVGVPLLTWQARAFGRAFEPSRWPGTLALFLIATAATAGALLARPTSGAGVLALLCLPPLMLCWLSLRDGVAVAAAVLLVLAAAVVLAAAGAAGPLVAASLAGLGDMVLVAMAAGAALVLLPHVLHGELARREERWQRVLDASDLGVAEWNLRTGHHYTSPRWQALLADADGTEVESIDGLLSRVHPDDRAPLLRALEPAQGDLGGQRHHETRLRVGEAWNWFDLQLIVNERDADGAPVRVVASMSDIGARRGAQDRQQLSANLFMHLHEGLLITDDEMRVLDANPTYSRITGIPRDELLGKVPALLRSGSAPDLSGRVHSAAMWAALRNDGHWVGEVIDRRRNGDPCALHLTISAVDGPDGALRYHVLVVSDITEQRLQRERLARQTNFDELTRLPNRNRLSQLLAEGMRGADADGHLLAVCYLDIDHFKAVNERLGPEAGDRLLAELAIRLRSALRARGSTRDDVAARLGGDEFALLLHAGSIDEARAAVQRVLGLIAQPFAVGRAGEEVTVTASVGVTVYPFDGSDADTLLRHADNAMYGAKQAGRNGSQFFDPEHRRRNEERVVAIGRVQEALDDGELMLYYQPKVDLRRGVVLGCEALLRWNHPDRGVVSPAQFLPLIEHTGLSARIGDHVLARALDQLDAWHGQGLDLSVSVNISARHLQEADFVQRLAELLARHPRQLGPHLELEVLETAALTDIGFTSALLGRCARLGVRWALDDFGTGYSTLTYLKRLPVQVLKIDRSFIQNMLTDAQDKAIVEGVISLARTFDCVAVAEGVETAAQARMLLDMGCEVGQGEGIAAPMPAEQLADWIGKWRGMFALAPAGTDRNPAAG